MVALEAALQFEDTRESMQAFCVGQYIEVKSSSPVFISVHEYSGVKLAQLLLPVSSPTRRQ